MADDRALRAFHEVVLGGRVFRREAVPAMARFGDPACWRSRSGKRRSGRRGSQDGQGRGYDECSGWVEDAVEREGNRTAGDSDEIEEE